MTRKKREIQNARIFPLITKAKNHYNHIVYDGIYCVPEADLYRGENLNFFSYERESFENSNFVELKGNCIYLGVLDSHYGHSITETFSRLHSFDLQNIDYFLFSYRNKKNLATALKTQINDKLIKALQNYGTVVYIDQTYSCEMLSVPLQSMILGHSCSNLHFNMIQKLFDIKKFEGEKRVYVSRTQFKNNLREYYDEELLEKKLKKIGFDVVYPELLSLDEQIEMFSKCSILVGMEGTALLNSVWSRNSNLMVISLGYKNRRNKTQKNLCFAKNDLFKLIDLEINNSIDYIYREIVNASI